MVGRTGWSVLLTSTRNEACARIGRTARVAGELEGCVWSRPGQIYGGALTVAVGHSSQT